VQTYYTKIGFRGPRYCSNWHRMFAVYCENKEKANLIAHATSIPFIHRALLGIYKLKAKLGKISADLWMLRTFLLSISIGISNYGRNR
jgi:hypothetical protein